VAARQDLSHAFTDLMTSLAVIFILLLVATIGKQKSVANSDIEAVRRAITEALPENFSLEQDDNDPFTQIIKLDDNKLKFAQNLSEMSKDGSTVINKLFHGIVPALCQADIVSKVESIIFEGHASKDGDKTAAGRLGNVKLSQDRAFQVLATAIDYIEKWPDLLKKRASDLKKNDPDLDCIRTLSSATGRGTSRPIPSASMEENRRVEIKIRVKAPMIIQKKDLAGEFDGQK
jgi:outer membrane protein OmpA-like peptidoglycan-associated protein